MNAEHPLMADARALVHDYLERFGQIATPDEVERAAKGVVNALPASVRHRACKHKGWNFEEHGRCCSTCGAFIVDFGD